MRLALILAVVALVAGCGEDGVPEGGPAPGPKLASLAIIVDGKRTSVACDTADESPECEVVDAIDPAVFEPTAGNVACTQQYGGPEKATVTGELRGEEVDASFSRENGCEIARWEDAKPLLDLAG